MRFVTFENANTIADEFLTLLSARNITPAQGTGIEGEFLCLTELIEVWRNPGLAAGADTARVLRNAAGVHDFAAKVLSCRDVSEFSEFDEHLKLISTQKLKTTLSQTTENDPLDDTARKLVELYVACLAAHSGVNVRLDHPTSSKGDNPDILLTYDGQEWALAIKTPRSRQGQSLFENIKKAVDQIERSPAEKGLVVISAKNVIDHQALWDTQFINLDEATDALREQLLSIADEAARDRDKGEWDALFAGNKSSPPVLFIGQSVVLLPTPASDRTPTPLKVMLACFYDQPADDRAIELSHSLTHWMQVILLGEPGPLPS
ncbi:hypothetical protein [Sinorhizobium meliloti]|uniref:hypothetical protein n=1 Tax=Rhizobium meliloti TaxID=382 RepID=UPI000A810291|nr:hypothetical protein [Sinorhizobium meliloti]MDW9616976.1 hypothetical protein [Sinorhizobium meliloti]RVE83281.1 hypothetical protein CN240_09970 [Sinorhizobium meliloti]RVG45198.1 hypothetical protein CN227_15820 [Sinorhizobium meliloti]RVO96487.1 hypothetical protein CN089_08410 [Sinorhizobium meliloti]RVQ15333.1 hypothetical protein CN096_13080 [Sinorhizobium meliloti]